MALIAGAAGAKLAQLVANKAIQQGIGQGAVRGQKLLEEKLGYDFIGLAVKIMIFYGVALVIQTLHNIIAGSSNFWIDLINFFGANVPKQEPNFLKKLFTDEGVNGIKYWNIINFIVIGLVMFEAFMYMESQKRLGGSPSPFALATFGIILFLLSAFTLPDLMNKLKSRISQTTQEDLR